MKNLELLAELDENTVGFFLNVEADHLSVTSMGSGSTESWDEQPEPVDDEDNLDNETQWILDFIKETVAMVENVDVTDLEELTDAVNNVLDWEMSNVPDLTPEQVKPAQEFYLEHYYKNNSGSGDTLVAKVANIDGWNKFGEKIKAVYGDTAKHLRLMCSSSLDFPREYTDDDDIVALSNALRGKPVE